MSVETIQSAYVNRREKIKAREPTVEIESGARNLEAASIRSRAENTGWCVKFKTVTEIRRSSARAAFIAESVYLVLNSLLKSDES